MDFSLRRIEIVISADIVYNIKELTSFYRISMLPSMNWIWDTISLGNPKAYLKACQTSTMELVLQK